MNAVTTDVKQVGDVKKISLPVINLVRNANKMNDFVGWHDEPHHEHWGDDD